MKILFLTPWYPDKKSPHHGLFIRDQARILRRDNIVEVVSAKIDYTSFALYSYSLSRDEYQGIVEHRIVMKRSLPVINQLLFFIIIVHASLRIARSLSPDIIHGNIGYPGAFWSWALAKSIGRQYVITEHTRITNNFRSRLHRWMTIPFLRKASKVISVSSLAGSEIQAIAKVQPMVIPNIVDFARFNKLSLNDATVPQIGFLGGYDTPVKGLDIFLKAIAGIDQDFVVHIGGDGKLLGSYKTLAQELGVEKKCRFYGRMATADVPGFMMNLHFFVSASRYETFGVAMVEAMACGLPVVATECGGPLDFIKPFNGVIVQRENVELLRAAIQDMLQHFKQYDAHAIREYAVSNYSAEKFLERIRAVYQDARHSGNLS